MIRFYLVGLVSIIGLRYARTVGWKYNRRYESLTGAYSAGGNFLMEFIRQIVEGSVTQSLIGAVPISEISLDEIR